MWVLKDFGFEEIKTKKFVAFMEAFDLKNVLVVLDEKNVNVERSARNIPGVKVLRVEGLNVYDILAHENLILVERAVERIQEVL